MCGILGYYGVTQNISRAAFENALEKLSHRGPDGQGVYNRDNLFLGHRRLSIIDLSEEASQPFFSNNGDACIIFNGEIYNYESIKDNICTRTSSDTEVLLEGYLSEGTSFFHKIRGMYSFCIYDFRNEPKIHLLRDPGGIKPLYYYSGINEFVFASEIKAILPLLEKKPELNESIIKQYIHLGYCPEPETVYYGIKSVVPGRLMTLYLGTGRIEWEDINSYGFERKNNLNFTSNRIETNRLLITACNRNMVADVDMAIALSGGIDSSLVYALSNKNNSIQGITVRFSEKDYDEGKVAEEYARLIKASHISTDVEYEGKLDLLNKLLLHFDQPYADSSFIPFFFLCKKSSEYCKVLIGGDGGDEIHNGYAGHKYLPLIYRLSRSKSKVLLTALLSKGVRIFPKERQRQIRKLCSLIKSDSLDELIFKWESWFPPDSDLYPIVPFKYDCTISALNIKVEKTSIGLYPGIEKLYFTGRMRGDYLRKSDMMAMINSIEFRVPMLDEDLVRYSLSIPYRQKSTLTSEKKILRAIHARIFPSKYSKLKKRGFSIPLDTWLGHTNLMIIRSFLTKENTFVSKFIENKYIDILFESLENNDTTFVSRASVYQRILILYGLELWYDNYKKCEDS